MYYRLTDSLNSVGKLIPITDNPYKHIKDLDSDHYLSIYKYNEEQKNIANEVIHVTKEVDGKTVEYDRKKGIEGIEDVTCDKLCFDIDNNGNLEQAKLDTAKVYTILEAKGIPKESIEVSFSGCKGFSIIVPLAHDLTPQQHKNIAMSIAQEAGITIDPTLYNASRVFRLNHTRHPVSGLYKTPITETALKKLSINDVLIKAKKNKKPDVKAVKRIKISDELLNVKPVEQERVKRSLVGIDFKKQDIDFSLKPPFLSETKYVLHKGFIPPGYSNTAFMILCSTYRNAGFDAQDAYHMLKGVNEKRAAIYNIPKKDNTEIWTQIISCVYSSSWNGGMYTDEGNDLLGEIKNVFATKELMNLTSIESVGTRFLDFASNINKNIIRFGIPSLDASILLTTGMMVGILGAPSSGKCLGKGTLVRMFDGSLKAVEDIQVGELLMGDDSTPRKVLSTCSGKEMLYKVKQENGDDYIVNESHILSLKNNVEFKDDKRKKQFSKKVIDIDVLDYLSKGKLFKKHYRGYKVGVEYPIQHQTIDPYILGYWLGNGTSSKPEITTIDGEVVDYFSKTLGLQYTVRDEITYNFVSKKGSGGKSKNPFTEELRKHDLINNKHIPKNYLYSSQEQRLELFAGIIDSDGYYDSAKRTYEVTFKDDVLAWQTVELARSLGMRATLTEKNAKYKSFTKGKLYEGTSPVNRIYINPNGQFVPSKLKRKTQKIAKFGRDTLLTSIEIEKLDVGDYYGFEIDGNKRFLLGDYTVTHNTSFVTKMLETTLEAGQRAIFLSLDMHDNLLFQRLIQRQTGKDVSKKLRKLISSDPLYDKKYDIRKDKDVLDGITKVSEVYKNADFNFTRGATIESVEEDIRNCKQKYGNELKLVVVDYLEKIRGPYSDATANSGYVASRLSDLASTYDVCIVLLLQPQKSAGDPSEELTSMRNVKGASVIEQDCRAILTLWRPGFDPKDPSDDKYATIAIVKNNMGELCTLDYGFKGMTGQFTELTDVERDYLEGLRQSILEEKINEKKDNSGW